MWPLLPVLVASMMMFSLFGVPGTASTVAPEPTPAAGDVATTVVQPVPGGVALCFYDANGDNGFGAGDSLYLDHRSDTCGAFVGNGLIRLSAFGSLGPFTRVHFGDADLNLALANVCCGSAPGLVDGAGELDFYDADVTGSFTGADTMYADVNADNVVGPGDYRWTAFGAAAPGTIVAPGDLDIGLVLHAPTGTSHVLDDAFTFTDANGDGVLGTSDDAFLRLAMVGSTLSVNDIALATGSILAPDAPMVTPTLLPMNPAGVAICFHSSDGDAIYDHGEPLYLDTSGDACGTSVETNDIRLTARGSHPAFSPVRLSDDDFGDPLGGSGGPGTTSAGIADGTSELDFYDTDGNGIFNGGDTLYADLNGDNVVSIGDYRWTSYGSLPGGSVVNAGDGDATLTLATSGTNTGSHPLDAALAFWDLNGDGAYNGSDVPYLDLSPGGSVAYVEVNDVRLGTIGLEEPGRIVAASDSDSVATLRPVNGPGVAVCFHSGDGDNAYDPGDRLYIDIDSDQCGPTVGINDIRLNGDEMHPAFTFVAPGHNDFGLPLAGAGAPGTPTAGIADGASEIDYFDADGNGAFNPGDTLYADIDGDNRASVGDLRWTPFGNRAAGTVVASGDADVFLSLSQSAPNIGSHPLDTTLSFWDLNGDGVPGAHDRLFLDLVQDTAVRLVSIRDVELPPDPEAPPTNEHDNDGDGWFTPSDCNDQDPTIHPGAPEVLNGVDDDCDGLVDETAGPGDLDGDGWFTPDDCDDGDSSIHPNNNELDNGIDDDCDGIVDEGLDLDGDGHTPIAGGDCDDANVTVHPGQNEIDNGIDDDCDGVVDDGYDLDSDGYTPIFGNDCDDSSAAVHPGQNEVDNGVDDDCDGLVDEGYDLDGDGYTPIFGGDCNDGDALIHPNNNELDNGLDDDCDGSVDEGLDLDGDSFTPIFGGDCNDGDPLIHPGANERDNVLDDDCDGLIDDGVDSDHDGLDYPAEQAAGTDPFDADSDDDGLVDGQELHAWGTDPLDPDTDDDLFEDGNEVQCGSDPNDPLDFLPTQCLVPTLP